MTAVHPAWVLGLSYAAGSVSFAYWAVKWRTGTDLRTVGSGNLGATNAARVLGRSWGVAIYVLDFLKGLVPVLVAEAMPDCRTPEGWPPLPLLAGLAAFVGHCLPMWHGFRGGKGVATGSGLVVGLASLSVVAAVGAAFGLGVAVSRTISLGSILASATLPIAHYVLTHPRPTSGSEGWSFALFILVGLLVIVRHRANMKRLLAGEEPRIGGNNK